jgi:hypothetical protein
MLFKVRSIKTTYGVGWWVQQTHDCTDKESEAYVFDTNSVKDMTNFLPDFDKREHKIKIVREK